MQYVTRPGGHGGMRPDSSGGRGGTTPPPPVLELLPDEPRYDLAMIVQLLGVRPMTLWAWEQQLGVPGPARPTDEAGPNGRRYSERDLAALVWLRDRIVDGMPPLEAASRLSGARGASGTLERAAFSGPLRSTLSGSPRTSRVTRRLSDNDTSPEEVERLAQLHAAQSMQGGPGVQRASMTGAGWAAPPRTTSAGVGPDAPTVRPQATDQLAWGASASGAWGTSGAHATPETATSISGSLALGREVRGMVPALVRAFATLDTAAAARVLGEALTAKPIETVCIGLLQPALTRIAELWARRDMSNPEEHFAVNFIRGYLFSVFHATVEAPDAPLVIVGCGPREMNDVHALMLAVFWRRAGLRVVYIGQDPDGQELVEAARHYHPALVALSISNAQRVRTLARVARHMAETPAPRPVFAFGGTAFTRHPDLQRKVPGVFLGDDPAGATTTIRRLLAEPRSPYGR